MSDINTNASWFAYFALLIWPIVALYLYSRLPVGQATMWTILGGYLLLPDNLAIKFKMIPAFDKTTIPNLAALIGCAVYARRLPKFFHAFGIAEILILLILIGPFITSLLNGDEIRIGSTVLPGVDEYDAGSEVIYRFIFMLPFFLGRQFVRSSESNAEVLRVLVIAGLAYSLPMLFEVRMSPQLSTWIYGYQGIGVPNAFRDGGARPVVFLTNGLLVAFFAMTATVAAAALWRMKTGIRQWPPGGITIYLTFVLVLCKTLGALVYGACLVPLVRWASPRLQLRLACVLVTIALAYPVLREADVFPTNAFLRAASVVSVDRAHSLGTRFENENLLLERASERPLFGWGRYGRSRVYGGWLGSDNTLSDGYWIIILGGWGIVGFVGTFGLLSLPVFRATVALKFAQLMREALSLAALALIVAINVVDLLPNASILPWTWLLAGALLGRAEALRTAGSQMVHFQDRNLLIDHHAL
jgi:hypothetical protein